MTFRDLAIIAKSALLTILVGAAGYHLLRPAFAETQRPKLAVNPTLRIDDIHLEASPAGTADAPSLALILHNPGSSTESLQLNIALQRLEPLNLISRAPVLNLPTPHPGQAIELIAAPGKTTRTIALSLPAGNGPLSAILTCGNQTTTVSLPWQTTGEK